MIANEYKYSRKNSYYHLQLEKLYRFLIPPKQKILDIGSGTGDLLYSLKPSYGLGVDISEKTIKIAKKRYPSLHFLKKEAANLSLKQNFDYIIFSDLIGSLNDIQKVFSGLHTITHPNSRIIISYNNFFWVPLLKILEKIGFKKPQPTQSWLSYEDISNLLNLSDFEIIKKGEFLLIPFYIPFLSFFINTYIARLPLIRNLCFVKFLIVRKNPIKFAMHDYSVSIILPARNESGNIEKGVREMPNLGKNTEIIFVEDHSTDNTKEEIIRVVDLYKNRKKISYYVQTNEYGKAMAVRKGFAKATGDILIVFDSDLSTDASELPKFYQAMKEHKAEFIQGSRLIYPIEKDAMRFLNILGNKFFSIVFTYLLDQQIKDTLCGTKVLFRSDYKKIVNNRDYFGDFDPFGDFDLIFGSSKLNLKIMEIPIRYKARIYGRSNIHRFRHGWLLFRMTIVAASKIKFF